MGEAVCIAAVQDKSLVLFIHLLNIQVLTFKRGINEEFIALGRCGSEDNSISTSEE